MTDRPNVKLTDAERLRLKIAIRKAREAELERIKDERKNVVGIYEGQEWDPGAFDGTKPAQPGLKRHTRSCYHVNGRKGMTWQELTPEQLHFYEPCEVC